MTAFIRGLFKKKDQPSKGEKTGATPQPRPRKEAKQKKPKPEKASQGYFLEDSDAVSLGNMEYMKAVKKASSASGASQSESQSQAANEATPRRRPDRNMDTFRKMARDIKK